MNVVELRRLFSYTEWANARMFNVVGELSPEQFTRRVESSFPSVGATLAHIAGSEWVWMRRFRGVSPTAPPDWTLEPSPKLLREKLTEVEHERSAYLDSLNAELLGEMIDYRNLSGDPKRQRLGDLLLHVVNHSTYHRGQLTTMLRQVGAVPPGTDLLQFNAER